MASTSIAEPSDVASDKIRVLFVSHAYVVGVNQGKLNAIAQAGATVGLLAPSNWKALEWNRSIELEKPYAHLQIYSAPVLFSGKGGAHLYAPWTIWQVLADFQPDIVQVEEEVFSLSTLELAVWSRLNNVPIAVFGWENLDRRLPLLRRWCSQFVLATAKAIIPGNQDGADLMRRWGYQGAIEVMPQMGVDPDFFAPRLSQIQSSDQPFRIGFVGRLEFGKGVDLIFAAVRQLQARGLDCHVILCGSGSIESTLRQEAEQQQIADRVIWRGAVPHNQVPAEISQLDVLVLPSRTTATWKEQFGHILIEAMAMGVPVVGSSSGEIPHVIGCADLVFPEEDAEALAAILERLICDRQWRQQVSQSGIDRVNQNYTHERIADRLIQLWGSILKSH